MSRQRSLLIPYVLAALLLLCGCGTASIGNTTLSTVAVPPTPTASLGADEVSKDSEPAFALLRETQQSMQQVSSYYFKQDNYTDTNTSDTIEALGSLPDFLMRLEGQAKPPIGRYQQRQGTDQFENVVVGKKTYFMMPGSNEYTLLSDKSTLYNPFLVTGALNNPQEYINFTLDTAKCATIVGDENVAGVATTHLTPSAIDD